jgi:hypothetical protein
MMMRVPMFDGFTSGLTQEDGLYIVQRSSYGVESH